MKPLPLFLIGSVLVCLVFGCGTEKSYKMATASKSSSYFEVGEQLSNLLNRDELISIDVQSDATLGSYTNCQLLLEGKVDFALAQNDPSLTRFVHEKVETADPMIRTVMPLYPELLFILYPDSIQASTLNELISGRRVYVGGLESGTARFTQQVFDHLGVLPSQVTYVYDEDAPVLPSAETPIIFLLSGYNNGKLQQYLKSPNMQLFSLGDAGKKGTVAESFSLIYHQARPFVIPKQLFGLKPEKPVLTLALDALLLTHKNVDEELIHDITEDIYRHRQILSSQSSILGNINESFDHNDLSFPLHYGARRFFDRNEPTIFERYAELFGVVFSVLLTLFGAASTFLKWRERKKKDRIDVFYADILVVEKAMPELQTKQELENALENVEALKQKAFKMLIQERLMANESFGIFMQLVDSLILRLEQRMLNR